ncbi:hypothetical protein EZV62_012275 [Acer yangbiense]|uniref:CCHC-type domain-containing protein n=1 Tax=Acer yangbiense TaxID=1000413 RepID=A0A5C7HXM5_9ROSI|nr:hypothetical protein EZV62_012275 [Acer yangbiense]
MSADEVARLCASMSLKERDGPVRTLQTDLKDTGLKRMTMSLNVDDKRKIISGGPWSFNDALIVMEDPGGKGDVNRMKFNKAEFWIQIHNVPMICMTEDTTRFLGSIIGYVQEIDGGDTGSNMVKFLRVRVKIDVDIPLRRCLRVDTMGDGVESVMLLKYERLPDFCFRCGHLGHSCRDCPDKLTGDVAIGEEFLYGPWMRAPTPFKRNGGWGRRWELRGGGETVRFQSRDHEIRGGQNNAVTSGKGGHLPGTRMMEDRGLYRTPVLESNKIGKEIAIDPMEGNRAGSADKTDVSGIQGNQGYDEGGNLGPNYMRENGDSIRISNLNYIPVDNEVGRIKAIKSTEESKDQTREVEKENQLLVFTAQNSQSNLGDLSLVSTWKRRARNHHRSIEQNNGGVVIGKKNKGAVLGKAIEISKKQKFVSSGEDSTDACFMHSLKIPAHVHFHDFMIIYLSNLGSGDLELLCVILWRIWSGRNQIVHNGTDLVLEDVF